MTQCEAILQLLRERPAGVTAIDALELVGSFRLAARIADLRHDGFDITSTPERTPSGKVVARYQLQDRPGVAVGQLALPL